MDVSNGNGASRDLLNHVRPIPSAVPPLVFLPALGFSAHSFEGVARALGDGAPSLLVDLPATNHRTAVGSDAIVGAVADALDGVRDAAPVLVGHSIGGAIAVRLIARRHFPASALVLVDAAVAPFALSWWERLVLHPLVWVPLLRLAGAGHLVRAALPVLLREPPIVDARSVDELARTLASARRRAMMLAYYRAFLAPDELVQTEHDLGRVRLPVLILRGARDHVLPPTVMARVADALPPTTPVETRQFAFGGHLLPLEEPVPVAHAIADFVRELPRLRALQAGGATHSADWPSARA